MPRIQRNGRIITAAAMLTWGVLLAGWTYAQPPQPTTGTRAYPVRYVEAAQIADQLRTMFASLRGEGSVAVDPRTNQVLVQGGEAAHALATQLISRVDRPQNAERPAAGGDEPVVEAYAVPDAMLQKTLAGLRANFPPSTGIKFAANDNGNQILTLAPPQAQVHIARHLAEVINARPARTEPQKIIQDGWQLRHLDTHDALSGLMQIWGRRLPTSTSEDGSVESFSLPAATGANLTVQVNHRTGAVKLHGPSNAVNAWRRVVAAIDSPNNDPAKSTAVMPLRYSQRDKVEFALAGFRAAQREAWAGDLVNMIFQSATQQVQAPNEAQPPAAPGPDGQQPPENAGQDPVRPVPPPLPDGVVPPAEGGGVIGPVQIEFMEGLDVIIIRGNKRDVDRVTRIIEDIERLSAQTEPTVEVYELQFVDNEAVVTVVTDVYNQYFAPRYGSVTITPLVKPNAVLLVGRPEAVAAARNLITKVDQPVPPDSQFRVYQLKHMPVAQAEETLTEFYEERGGLGTRVRVSADFRSNSIIVQGSPRDLDEISAILERLDVAEIEAVNELRVFHLRNTLADDLAPVIQRAIRGEFDPQTLGGGGQGAGQDDAQARRSTMLTLMTIDSAGGKLLKSGVLQDVQIQSDPRANALLVRGPAEAMDLIGALIEQLDRLPSEAQIKVFTIVNGDASSLATTLDELFGLQQQGQNQPGVALGAGQGDSTLVPLRFSVDLRTNSILASGSGADLKVVEALLLRLDEGDIRERVTVVYRLKNSPALDVAAAINEFLGSERQVQQLTQGDATPFEQIEREVVVVPEPVSNSLIVSASPRFFPEVEAIVEKLDERPPMVLIQVLIAEVALNDTDEIGVELGIQDSLLFDRSAIVDGLLDPGFNFNNRPLGNSSDPASLATRENLAGQALTTLAVGRVNNELGYGGLVLSASNESLSVLLRALQDERSMQILSRPQVMTLDNQPAFVQVGQRVPRITSSNIVDNAVINNTTLENVGILLGVTPRIAPDGQVVMEIDAEKSEVGPESDGIPISINDNGDVIRSPRINIITAQTTVSARSGQTVILGGLITRSTSTVSRKVPYLSDVPVMGNLFRFDSVQETRGELLFIMTPYIVRGDEDIEFLKHMESSRMSWCLADVVNVHGHHGLTGAYENPYGGPGCACTTVYPDQMPYAMPQEVHGEVLPEQPPRYVPEAEQLPSPVPQGPLNAPTGPEFVPEQVEPGRHEFGARGYSNRGVAPAQFTGARYAEVQHVEGRYVEPGQVSSQANAAAQWRREPDPPQRATQPQRLPFAQ